MFFPTLKPVFVVAPSKGRCFSRPLQGFDRAAAGVSCRSRGALPSAGTAAAGRIFLSCHTFGVSCWDGVVRKEPVARADTRVQRISFRPLRLPDLGPQNNGVILPKMVKESNLEAVFCFTVNDDCWLSLKTLYSYRQYWRLLPANCFRSTPCSDKK